MSTFREKAQGRTKQMVGQMIGDELLVEEGKDQEWKAEQPSESSDDRPKQTSPNPVKATTAGARPPASKRRTRPA